MEALQLSHLSFSQMSTLAQCGEKYRLTRRENAPRAPAWALIGGKAFHAVTEVLDKRDFGIKPGPGEWVDFEDAFYAEIAATVLDQEDPDFIPIDDWRASGRASKAWPNKEDKAWWLAHGDEWVGQYRNWLNRQGNFHIWITPEGVPAIELEFLITVGGVPVKGYIDRIFEGPDGGLGVCDLKTGTSPPRSARQLGLYALAVRERFGRLPSWGMYYMSRLGTHTPPEPLGKYTDGRLEWEVGNAWRMAQEGMFLPHESNLCTSCEVRKFCYAVDGEEAGQFRPW